MDGSVIIEAVLNAEKVTSGVKDINGSLQKITWKDLEQGNDKAKALSGSLKSAGTACTVGLTTPILAAGTAALATASQYDSAASRIQAQLGVTSEYAEHLTDVARDIYADGFGVSFDDVSGAISEVRNQLGGLNDADLSYVTKGVLTLSDLFGMDVNESIRGVNALMDGFGMTAQGAMDLLATCAQYGINYTDELGDNLAEYGPRFAQMGFSAEEYFQILQNGVDSGAYSLDKCNDFLNEFQTSLSDGRMEENIGSFSQSTQDLFEQWKNGAASGKDVYNAVISDLAGMENGYEQAQVASALWSSLGEDNAMQMITAMDAVNEGYQDVEGAAQRMADSASENLGSKATGAVRSVQDAVASLAEGATGPLSTLADAVKGVADWFASLDSNTQQTIATIAIVVAAIGPVLSVLGSVSGAVQNISGLVSTLQGGFGLLQGAASTLGGGLSTLFGILAANPILIVVAAVAALIGGFVYLWNTCEPFREFWMGLWDAVCQKASEAWAWIDQNLLQPLRSGFKGAMDFIDQLSQDPFGTLLGAADSFLAQFGIDFPGFRQTVSNVISGAQAFFNDPFGALRSAGSGVLGWFSSNFPGLSSTVSSAISAAQAFFRDPFAPLRSAVNDVLGWVRSNFKLPEIKFPEIKLPHIPMPRFRVSGSFSLMPPRVPSISVSWHARGGVFDKASVIGVGEAGPEAVVPLLGRRMAPFAQAVADNLGAGSGSGQVSVTIQRFENYDSSVDVDRLVRLIAQKVRTELRARGRS